MKNRVKQFRRKFYNLDIIRCLGLYLLFIVCILFVACRKNTDKFNTALKLSGENKKELLQVINHYNKNKTDSLKLRAAYFLIENMPGHYTLKGEIIDKCRKMIEEDTISSYYNKKLMNIVLSHFVLDKTSYQVEDIQSIKADYLIQHIDASFELLEKYSWLDVIPFDIFLEYVLPYRFTDEPIDCWRDSLHVLPRKNMQNRRIQDYFINECSDLLPYLGLEISKKYNHNLVEKILNIDFLEDCYYLTYSELLESRALGIPSMVHYIPFYANRNGYHYWKLDPPLLNKKNQITRVQDRRMAKVFRQTFSPNNIILTGKKEYIPDFFKNPFAMDVTDLYSYTTDIKVNINHQINLSSKYGYLCVFNNLNWEPIVMGEITKRIVSFNKVAKNIVYLPVYYKKRNDMKALHYPFILKTNGKLHTLIPDTCVKQTLSLYRKNPDLVHTLSYFFHNLAGNVVEASNSKDFKNADTLFIFNDSEGSETNTFQLNTLYPNNAYRWYRICSNHLCYIAELYFYSSTGEFVYGKVNPIYEAAIDRNPLTNIELKKDNPFIIDFGKPVVISKLNCLPRNDGNGIYPDNVYELRYYDLNGWHSLGRKTTNGLSIKFENVPTNALYWLHNITSGFEERIFTYEQDKVHFW